MLANRFNQSMRLRFYTLCIIQVCLIMGLFYSNVLGATGNYQLEVQRYEIQGENPLSDDETETLLKPYTGPLKGLQQLQEAATRLQNALQEKGFGFFKVSLAPQTLNSGVVQLNISAIKVSQITVKQGFIQDIYFSSENIRASIPSLKVGESPNIYQMARELALANKNPSKRLNVQFSRSEQRDQIDANILASSEEPYKYYTWLNNTGTKYTGDYRLGIGFRHNNLFDKDHELALSFTTSPDYPRDVQQYGVSYRIPLYEQLAVWQLYAYYSDIDSGVVAGGFDVSGSGTFIGSKYEWHLPHLTATKAYSHQLVLGIDDKLFDNEVFFTGSALGNDVRSTPFSISYRGLWKEIKRSLSFYIEFDRNLELGSLNSDVVYGINRYKAKADWELWRVGMNGEWHFNQWMLKGRVHGQYTDQALISGEQFGIGGVTGGVRGFIERELSGDKGIRGSLEFYLPPTWNNQLRILGFVDAGYISREHTLPGEVESEGLISAGMGVIWKRNNFSMSVYLSQALNGNGTNTVEDPTQKGDNKVHFNLFMSF